MALVADGGFRLKALFKCRLQLLAVQTSGLYSCMLAAAAALVLSGAANPWSAGDHFPKKEGSLALLPVLLLLLLLFPLVLLLLRGDTLHAPLPSASLVLMGMRCGGVGKPEGNAGVFSVLAASRFSMSAP